VHRKCGSFKKKWQKLFHVGWTYKFYSVSEKCVKCINIKFFPIVVCGKYGVSPYLGPYLYFIAHICIHMDRPSLTRGFCSFSLCEPKQQQQSARQQQQLLRPRINAKRFTCEIRRLKKRNIHRENYPRTLFLNWEHCSWTENIRSKKPCKYILVSI